MKNFIECTVLYDKSLENGVIKSTKEVVIVRNCVTLGEAERIAMENIAPFSQGETSVTCAKEKRYAEFVETQDEKAGIFFEVGISVITIDEQTGKEKKTKFTYLVQASDIDDARYRFSKHMKGYMLDIEVNQIKQTQILEIYDHDYQETQSDRPSRDA